MLSASHILVDGAGVRQLGALASELAKQTAGKAQEQERTVLGDARRLGLDTLYTLPPLPLRPPADSDLSAEFWANTAQNSARKRRKGRKGLPPALNRSA